MTPSRMAVFLLAAGLLGSPAWAQGPCFPQSEMEPNNTAAAASPVVLFSPEQFVAVSGTIGAPGDVDWYSFTAPAGARLWLAVDTGVAPAGYRDSVVAVIGPDQTTMLESDDDDGTGNGRDSTIESLEASSIANRVLPAAGTYYAVVRAKSPAETIAKYVLMVAVSDTPVQSEVEPNDTGPNQFTGFSPILGTLSSDSDIDWYSADILDDGIPFLLVDGDPERDGLGTDVSLLYVPNGFPDISTDSSGHGDLGDPAAEGFAHYGLGSLRITGTGFPGASTYMLGIWFSGDGCPVPVELQGFEIR